MAGWDGVFVYTLKKHKNKVICLYVYVGEMGLQSSCVIVVDVNGLLLLNYLCFLPHFVTLSVCNVSSFLNV